ncbi:MAG: non-ribosomal peptide synthase/polyketide synthase, partial [Acidobacteriota bacterium]
ARLYRSGDLARRTVDGELVYIGRADFQVKIRGFRIELGEIEAALSAHASIEQSAVLVREVEGDERLVAYVIPRDAADDDVENLIDTDDLRTHLAASLPEYMVPAAFVSMESFPLTVNGKLDRRALPDPEWGERGTRTYVAPRTESEQIVASAVAAVLGVEQVGIYDDFFALGGHSLLATKLVSRLRDQLGVDLPLRRIFETPDIAGIASAVEHLAQDALPPIEAVERVATEAELPLSFAQERLWFLARLEPDSPAYHIPTPVRLRGTLDVEALASALSTVVSRHEALRTVFREVDGDPVQVVLPAAPVALPVEDVTSEALSLEDTVVASLRADALEPFDLSTGPLLRARLLRVADDDHVLSLTMHHIVSDGWSVGVLIRELAALYAGESLPELPIQVGDVAVWQREHLALDDQVSWWREHLAGVPVLELPTDRPRPAVQTWAGATIPVHLDADTSAALTELTRSEEVTLFMALLGVYTSVLGRWSGQDDVAVGTPIANRTRAEVEPLIGFFVNTLVVRTDLSADPSFRGLLQRIKKTTLEAYARQDVPFERLVAELEASRDMSQTPLFQAMLSLQNAPTETAALGEVAVEPIEAVGTTAKFDLLLALGESDDGLRGALEWNTDLFDRTTIERFVTVFERVMRTVVANPDLPLSRLPWLDESTLRQRLTPPALLPLAPPTLHERFFAHALRNGDAPAVSDGTRSLTYGELATRARRLAGQLQSLGVGAETRVGLCLGRSVSIAEAILGVLAVGGVYVPLDPSAPSDRLAFILEDAEIGVLVTTSDLELDLSFDGTRLELDQRDDTAVATFDAVVHDAAVDPDQAAYVIYTSGSTGTPKGTPVSHRNVLRLFQAGDLHFDFGATDVWTLFHSYAFDFSVWEIWGALLYGGRLVVVPWETSRDPAAFVDLLRDEQVTVLNQTPSAFRQLVAAIEAREVAADALALRDVIFGGEALELATLKPWFDRFGDRTRLVNMYGITETTVHVTYREVRAEDLDRSYLSPIGEALADLAIYLLGPDLLPVYEGAVGEIWVAGAGLARGYLGRPALTAERFIPDPYSGVPGARLYRSGDLARRTVDGELVYIGRADFQVKIRGFRIELGEIEAALSAHASIEQSAVLVREVEGDERLVAYLVHQDPAEELDTTALRTHLAASLPEYMVPAAFVSMESFPLTVNGKLDRRALPDPEWGEQGTRAYVAPRTESERNVAAAIADVLGVEQVGVHDDFFALGGHSLLATRLIARLRDRMGVDLPLRQIFETPTVEGLAVSIETADQVVLPPIEAHGVDRAPMSLAQERLWLLAQLQPDSPAYNVPLALRLVGELDVDALQGAFDQVVARHDTLRTVFVPHGDHAEQVIRTHDAFALPVDDLRALSETDRQARLDARLHDLVRSPFDLEHGPLFRVDLLRLADDAYVLMVSMHHIVSDGWSLDVLLGEIVALYRAHRDGQSIVEVLPPLAVQYTDIALWQRETLGDLLDSQQAWWRRTLADLPVLELPTDHPRPAMWTGRGASVDRSIPADRVTALRALAEESGTTLFMTLMAVFQVVLARHSGQRDFAIGAPISGRHRGEYGPLIGFFVNTLVLRADLSGDPSFRELLRRVRSTVLAAFSHQDVPFERLVAELVDRHDTSRTPLAQVAFTVQDRRDVNEALPGIELADIELPQADAKFDLGVNIGADGDRLRVRIGYATDLFEPARVERLIEHFDLLLGALVAAPDRPVLQVPMLGDDERQRLDTWRLPTGQKPYPKPGDTTVAELVTKQIRRAPDAIAARFAGESLTYAELERRALVVAHRLQAEGAAPGSVVAVLAERSFELPVALYGILLTGAAYLPLDASWPTDRLELILRDAAEVMPCPALVTTAKLAPLAPPFAGAVIDLDALLTPDDAPASLLPVAADSSHPVYVLYTSGSTGRPKGVVIPQRALVNRLLWTIEHQTEAALYEALLQKTSISFDLSVMEIFGPLATGGCIVFADPDWRGEPEHLVEMVQAEQVTLLAILPSQLAVLLDQVGLEGCDSLRAVASGAEAVAPDLARRVREQLDVRFLNRYGPTETTVSVTSYQATDGDEALVSLPIGRPMARSEILVVDDQLELAPAGAAGEIMIGGDCLALGYLGRAARTAEAFVPHPWSTEPGARLYRSGDLGRWNEQGELVFLGRIDGQVKVRGYRVELGEIQAVLQRLDAVSEATVIDRPDPSTGSNALVAYLVATDDVETGALRTHVAESLPDYMVPSAFVMLDALPLGPTGKVDRRALPDPDWQAASEARYVAPRTDTERRIAEIFATVLDIESVGIEDDFFQLGGHSLLATRAMARIRETFDVELPLRELFAAPTVAALSTIVEHAERSGALPPIEHLERIPDDEGRVVLPTSSAQQRLWFLDRLDPGNAAYNMPFGVRLRGDLDLDALRRAVDMVVSRHEALRTAFVAREGRPFQEIHERVEVPFIVDELVDAVGGDGADGNVADGDAADRVSQALAAEAATRFDLATPPLLRLRLIPIASDEHVLITTFHHIVSDGWSMGVFIRELGALYDALVQGDEASLAPLPLQIADAALWQRRWLDEGRSARQLAYWREHLDGLTVLELPTDQPRGAIRATRGATVEARIDEEVGEALDRLTRDTGVTRFAVLMSVFQLLLAHTSGSRTFAVGTPTAGRRHPAFDQLIGFFVNTLVVRVPLDGDPSFTELVARTHDAVLDAQEHQDLPFETLVEELSPDRDLGSSPLVQVMFSVGGGTVPAVGLSGLDIEPLAATPPEVKLELGLTVGELPGGGLGLSARYAVDLFARDRIERLLASYATLLRAALETPERSAYALPILDAAAEQRLRVDFNRAEAPYPVLGTTLHSLVRRHIAERPEAPAVVFEGETITYAELGARSARLAHHLRGHGVDVESLVVVAAERSIDMVVALLATLEAGAAYVPIDPAQPAERIAAILADASEHAGVAAILTQGHIATSLPSVDTAVFDATVLELDSLEGTVASLSTEPPAIEVAGEHPAYVIYTSGTTGRPKGVVMSHRAVANRLSWVVAYDDTSRGGVLAKASVGFDLSVGEIFSPLVSGGRLVLAHPEKHADSAYLIDLIVREEVTQAAFLPVQLAALVDTGELRRCRTLRRIPTGGETVPPELPARVMEQIDAEVHNRYGPTETCISVIAHPCTAAERDAAALPIGKPIARADVFIVTVTGALAPIGVAGEILIGGVNLARGYLGDAARTAAAFVPHPWSDEPGGRLYRTGDLGRWRANGQVEFLGRIDSQIKVRGHRVELGEIQAVLRDRPELDDAVVVDFDDPSSGSRRLAAYVVSTEPMGLNVDALRVSLADRLPSYMVPATFVLLDRLPVTANGKIDLRALPEPSWSETRGERVAPRTALEIDLATIWAEVLGVDFESFGIDDDFFALGGHSLLATQVVSRIRERLGIEVPLRQLFETPTIAGIATSAPTGSHGDLPAVTASDDHDSIAPLSFAQERLWFIDQLEAGSSRYHIPMPLRLRGTLDRDALEATFTAIHARHDVLRTRFATSDGKPVQVVDEVGVFTLDIEDLRVAGSTPESRESEARRQVMIDTRRPIDLGRGPLWRIKLLMLDDDDHVLSLVFHHVIFDGWSAGILTREFAALYTAFCSDDERDGSAVLPPLTLQYADVARWQHTHLQSVLDVQLDWWRQQLAGVEPLELPADRPRAAVPTWAGAMHTWRLGRPAKKKFEELARDTGATEFMVMLAAFSAVLARWSGQEDITVGSPIANRARAEVEALIGFFVNTLVLRVDITGKPSFRELIARARDTTVAAYENQDLPFEKLVGGLGIPRDLSTTPLFQALLSWQRPSGDKVSLPDLELRGFVLDRATAKFDLSLAITERDDDLLGAFEYRTELFDAATIERFASHLGTFLEAALDAPDRPIQTLPLDASMAWREWAGVRSAYPRESNLVREFERTVKTWPDRVVLVADGIEVTRAELARRAGGLAHELHRRGVGLETPVAVVAERSVDMVIGMVGVIGAGGYYVPLDVTDPDERLAFIIEDTGARIVLSPERFIDRLPTGVEILSLEAATAEPATPPSTPWPDVDIAPESLANAIYTSGSTGRPKGVTVDHRNILRLVLDTDYADLGPDQTLAQLSSPAFDVSTFEIWASLLAGGRLVLPQAGALSLEEIGALVTRHEVSLLWLTAGLFHQMVDHRLDDLRGVEQLLSGGEALSVPHVSRVLAELDGTTMINGYGPTENTVYTTCHRMLPGSVLEGATVPVGRPVPNTTVYVLDQEMHPAPIGVPGELYTGGDGVARGYLERPALTAERFVPDPFATEPGARLYRTGDRSRWLADGTVEFLGRIDRQVKLRGFRVEPGEIEMALVSHPDVESAVAMVREDQPGDRRLAAYVVVEDGAELDVTELRQHVTPRLPSYMVPAALVILDELPLNRSGKVDRRALPAPEWGQGVAYEAPATVTEEAVATMVSSVLGIERVGRNDDFFALGGHSLLATQVVSRIREQLGVELPLRRLFETPDIAGIAAAIDTTRTEHDGRAGLPPIRVVERHVEADGSVHFPLSFAQERLWFLAQLDPESPAYHIPTPVRLRGTLDPERLTLALQKIVDRHDGLRTVFRRVDGAPKQVVLPSLTIELPIDEIAETELMTRVMEEIRRPFDLVTGPLLRARLFRLGDDDHVLALTVHHIVYDGWSMGVLIRELVVFHGDPDALLPPLPVQVPDVAIWQREHLAARIDEQVTWWRDTLDAVPVLELPTDRPRPAVQTWAGDVLSVWIPTRLTEPLERLVQAEGGTLFMGLLAVYAAVLGRWSGQDDFAIGTPIAGRTQAEMEPLIGFFVNTLVLRIDLDARPSLRQVLERSKDATLDAYGRQDVPFERLVAELDPDRDPSHSPLFQVMLSLQNAPFDSVSLGGDLTFEPVEGESTTAKFDLQLSLGQASDGLRGGLEWNTDLFDHATVERFFEHFVHLLDQALADPDSPLDQLALEPVSSWRERVGTTTDYPRDTTLPAYFASEAAARPESVVLVTGDDEVRRAELERRSRHLAHVLRARGVDLETPIALFAERSVEMVVAMLGVLGAGGHYVPLDPSDPDERLAFIIEDTGAQLAIVAPHLASRLPAELETLSLAELNSADVDADAWPVVDIGPDTLAYVIYTSGSTGLPKGVMATHRNVLRLVLEADFADLGSDQVYAQLSSPAFDAATLEIWAPLLGGGRLVLPPAGALSLEEIGALLARYQVTTLWLTAGLYNQMVDRRLDDLRPVRQLLAGGEALSLPHVERVLAELDATTMINGYGPTENTTFTTCHAMLPGTELDSATVPIGKPIADTTVHVLDDELMPTPIGVPGELYTGGDGVSRGYLRRPRLTAERYVPDPFATEPGARLYRSGDRVRWRADGTVEFFGRADRQIKLRGFRIEPGEIESALVSHPEVETAVVMVREDQPGDRRLVAYVVPDEETTSVDAATLREHITPRLPSYMMPAAILVIDALPLNRNGKVDRRALPVPEWQDESEYEAPSTDTERTVAAIYADVLGVDQVGRYDDFFATGGHSLLATQVVSQILEQLGVEIPLRQLFESPDVAGLAAAVDTALESSDGRPALPPITYVERPVADDGTVRHPLSFAQERLWFLAQLEPDSPAYHIPSPVRLRGVVDADRLTAALGAIVERHESLRTVFREIDGTPMQVVLPTSSLELPIDEIDETELLQAVGEETRRPFDLAHGPLLRARLFRLAADDHVLALTVHHIVYDGWSMGVLIRELVTFYGDPTTVMPALEVHYPDVAVWQREHLAPRVEEQVAWWRERLDGVPVLELPTDRPRPAVQTWAGEAASIAIPGELTASLEGLVQDEGGTVFMGLLAIFSALLGRWSGQADLAIGTPIAGRTRAEMEPLIGFFVNTLVLRVDLEGDPTLRQLLERARETTLDAYSRQDVPFERLVAELEPDRDLAHPPLFQVMLSLQNAPFERAPLDEAVVVEPVSGESTTAKFDMQLSFGQSLDGLRGGIEWNTDLFDRTTIERFLGHFQSLLEQAVALPDRPLSSFELRSQAEIDLLERYVHGPEPVVWPGTTIEAMIALQAEKTPDREALVDPTRSLTYAELLGQSRRLARHLRTLGVGPEVCVGVCMDRTVDLVVALLAVLEAGGAYAPLDPKYPADRLGFMLEDSRAPVVLTRDGRAEVLPAHDAVVVDLADDPAAGYDDGPLGLDLPTDRLAYLIYTSGSTGKPKGVAISHASAVVMLGWGRDTFEPELLEGLYAATSINFDVSVFELFGTLSLGGTVILGDDALAAIDHPRRDRVTLFSTVPSAIAELIRADGLPETTQAVSLGGEPVYRTLAESIYAHDKVRALYNMYGPSEDTTYTSVALIPAGVEHGEPTVGKPIHGDRLYVVDSELRQVPLGVRGELYIGGMGVSRGYLHRPGLTAERYVPDPFATEPGARLYRTGDRVRWRADGELLFEGRFDHQVKIRGHRVELGEIEAALLERDEVRDAVVMARGEGADKRLIAWITAADHVAGELDVTPVRMALGERLPGYMVPSAFVVLDRLPLLPNEKVDRKRLPTPEPTRSERVYVAPRTPLERQIAALFAEVLGVEQVGIEDDFFALGGHSLLATRLVSALRRELSIEVPLRQLFDTSDVAGLARAVERLDGSEHLPPITSVERQPTIDGSFHLPLSFAQERLWFLSQLEPDSPAYNIPSPVRLRG